MGSIAVTAEVVVVVVFSGLLVYPKNITLCECDEKDRNSGTNVDFPSASNHIIVYST